MRLGALTFWAAWPSLLSGAGAGIGSSICWWIWFGIILWPKALVGYEDEPPSVMGGGGNGFSGALEEGHAGLRSSGDGSAGYGGEATYVPEGGKAASVGK